jgi:glutaminase
VSKNNVQVLGDEGQKFLCQSSFKPLSYAMALNKNLGSHIEACVSNIVDKGYTDTSLSADGKALNPMINSGALIVLELLSKEYSVEEVGAWCRSEDSNA